MVKYIENYILYESIGSGVYGKVYRAINNTDKKEYAIKVIPINKFKENKKLEQCTVNEINILTNIESHPNIIKYYDMLKTSNNFYFIYQYCNGGTLQNLLTKQGKLTQQNALLIFKQLLQAFQVLNKYNIMHRDMKPDNIFFHNGVIKLGDFGFCKNLNSADQMTKTMLGSPIYMAPEVLKGEIYSNKADIWSVGVVLFEMIFGMCPFQSNSIANLIEVLNSKQLQFPGPISPFLKNLITRMLTKDPVRRASWIELFQIRINSQGEVQTERTQRINSLNQAKIFDQVQGQMIQTNRTQPKIDSGFEQPVRDFKKNRNLSGTNTMNNGNPNQNINISNNSNVGYTSNPMIPGIQQPNPNMLAPTNNKLMNPIYVPDIPKPTSSYAKETKVGDEHKLIPEGVRLAMQIIETKLPNHMGYAHLILTRCISLLADLSSRNPKKEVAEIMERELKDLEAERQQIDAKMFAYQLKGLQDWKKYLRGKFFEEESTILHFQMAAMDPTVQIKALPLKQLSRFSTEQI